MFINHIYHFFPIYIYIQNNVTHMDRKNASSQVGALVVGLMEPFSCGLTTVGDWLRCTLGGRQGEGGGGCRLFVHGM